MNKNILPTISIGIPAHNEEGNLGALLKNILSQEELGFKLQFIYVLLDGCNDHTEEIAKNIGLNSQEKIQIINDGKRLGKIHRLKQFYDRNESDFALVLDADVYPIGKDFLKKIVEGFSKPNVVLVGANSVPVPGKSFFEKIELSWSEVWHQTRVIYNNSDNIHNSRGCALALEKNFSKVVTFPDNITSDSQYLYLFTKSKGKKFNFLKGAKVAYRKPSNISDYLIQMNRSTSEKKLLTEYFGRWVEKEYKIPFVYKFFGLLSGLIRDPFYALAGGIFNHFLLKKFKTREIIREGGGWKTAYSTKKIVITENATNPNKTGVVTVVVILLVVLFLLTLILRGNSNNLAYYNSNLDTSIGSPFESSNSSSRYALVLSIVKNHSLFFDESLARFAAPDLVYYKEKFFSIFLPGTSFLAVPFYIVGDKLGLPQIFTYLMPILLSLANFFLLYVISRKLHISRIISLISGLIFTFGTTALPYSLTLTQHSASLLFLLLATINAFDDRNFKNDLLLGLIFGASILFDIPNIWILSPFVILSFLRNFLLKKEERKIKLSAKLGLAAIILGILPFVLCLGWYNKEVTGSPLKLGQTVGRSKFPLPVNAPKEKPIMQKKSIYESKLALDSRNLLNGIYILSVSDERGIFYYSPVLLLGILGLWLTIKRRSYLPIIVAIVSSILVTFISYAMFDDPWGGWSFGPRYMIPVMALLSLLVGYILKSTRKNIIFGPILFILITYSVYINTLGALTTNALPPKQEAENLVTPIPYTYKYNQGLINKNFSSSLLFNIFLKNYINAKTFHYIYSGSVILLISGLYLAALRERDEEQL